jgi:mRNA-degrading endonuclease toxin of MazEF toxin-antitoxin module
MVCERCRIPMVERLPAVGSEDADEKPAIVLECPQCGHTESQLVMASFWRRLAA